MATLSVLYPNQPDGWFDERYYLNRHIPLVRERWRSMGLTEIRLLRGTETPDAGPPPYRIMALVTFVSAHALRQALAIHRDEVFASIRRYTDIQPVMQVSEPLLP